MGKRIISCVFIAAMFAAVLSCSGPKYGMPEFRKETEAKFEIIGEELYGLNVINEVAVYGEYIVVAAPSQEDGKLIHV